MGPVGVRIFRCHTSVLARENTYPATHLFLFLFLFLRNHVGEFCEFEGAGETFDAAVGKFDDAVADGEERVIGSAFDVQACANWGATLAN